MANKNTTLKTSSSCPSVPASMSTLTSKATITSTFTSASSTNTTMQPRPKQAYTYKRTRAQAAMAILCITTNIHLLQSVPTASSLTSPLFVGRAQGRAFTRSRSRDSMRSKNFRSCLNSGFHHFENGDCPASTRSGGRSTSTSTFQSVQPSSTSSSTSLDMAPVTSNYIQLFTKPDKDQSDIQTNENSRWLSWMTGGTPRGVADVKMRDPDALGGIPRADRYASRDWLHNTLNLANSAILKSIRFPVLFMTFWGTTISLVHRQLKVNGMTELATRMCIPTQSHSLTVSALGLLLVFRTNSAYQRFAEGRKIWEEILSVARDLSRLGKLYEKQIGVAKLRRVNRLLAAFPYLLRFRIKPNSIMRKLDDPEVERDPKDSLILYQDHGM